MIAIGERINGKWNDVKKAINSKDAGIIHALARAQTECGASFLDINVGTATADKVSAMRWLVEEVEKAVDTPIAIDSQNLEVVRAGLAASRKNKKMINSTSGDPEKLASWLPLAAEHDASIIALTMDKEGIAQTVDRRIEIAATIVTSAMEQGVEMDHLFIDPVMFPLSASQEQPSILLQAISQIKLICDPAPHIVVGLSNVSNGCTERPLLNRTFLVMAIAAGLDSAIVDVEDEELMNAAIAAEVMLNKQLYSASFLRAGRIR
ncbi:MAG: dihydropteroate synthase [Planctomycetota bacterium]